MKNINFLSKSKGVSILAMVLLMSGLFVMTACEEDIPEAGSIPDATPPTADFSYTSEPGDDLTINFGNLSSSATSYSWSFGDGNSSTDLEPSNTYSEYGTYSVTLTATDGLGVSSSVTQDVVVAEGPYQPFILEPGFEDNASGADACGDGLDGRDCWRCSWETIMQITSSPVRSGEQGAKLPDNDERVGYQEIIVEPETNYDLNFYYTMLAEPAGYVTVSVLGDIPEEGFSSHDEAVAAAIGSITLNDQSDPEAFIGETVSFSSGDNTTVAIYFFNDATVETRLDDFSIDIAEEGAVPPSASFSFEQDETDYLQYAFTNGSLNATSYSWDFGDGNTSTEESPTHTYASASTYTVTLTASNDVGLSTEFSTEVEILAPVTSDFTYEVDPDDYRSVTFTSTSVDAVSLEWDFGNGSFSTSEPSVTHIFPMDGVYDVTLTAYSITGNTDESTQTITISNTFIPIIEAAGFNDGDDNELTKDFWRNSDLGGVLQISSSSSFVGGYASKYPNSNDRIAYQEITVLANTTYTLSYMYSMEGQDGDDRITVKVLGVDDNGGTLSDPSQIDGVTLASHDGMNGTGKGDFTDIDLTFSTGSNTTVAIYVENESNSTAYVDEFSIEEAASFIPTIQAAGFNDGDDNALTKDFWRNSDLGGVLQISSSSSFVGGFSSKYPNSNDRIAYQEITVEAGTSYTLTFMYSMEGQDGDDRVTVKVLGVDDNGGTLSDPTQISAVTLASHDGTIGTGKADFTTINLNFNSGSNTTVAIYVENESNSTAYVDEFSISVN